MAIDNTDCAIAGDDKETVEMIIQRTELWKCRVILLSVFLIMQIVSGSVFAEGLESDGSSKSSDTLNATMPGDKNWAINIYGGVQTNKDLGSTLAISPDVADSYYFAALALTRTIKELNQHMNIEGEGQIVKHFGEQNHMEINALLVGRWLTFPWNNSLTTSLAAGTGLSYATEVPKLEEKLHEETSQFLAYLMFELALSLPTRPQWYLITRIHHRSGAFGLFNDVHGASNALCLGIKYVFQ